MQRRKSRRGPLARTVEADPDERYQTAGDLGAAARAAIGGAAASTQPAILNPNAAPNAVTTPALTPAGLASKTRGGRRWIAASAVAVDPSTHTVYTTSWGDDTVSIIDTANASITGPSQLPRNHRD